MAASPDVLKQAPAQPHRKAWDSMSDENNREMDIAQLISSQLTEDEEGPHTPASLDDAPPHPELAPRWDKSPTVPVVRARNKRGQHAPSAHDGRLPETSILRKARVPRSVQALIDERHQQRLNAARAEEDAPPSPPTRPNAASLPKQDAQPAIAPARLAPIQEALATLRELNGYRACLLVTAPAGAPVLTDLRATPPLSEAEATTLRLLAQRYASTFEAFFPSRGGAESAAAPSEIFVSFGEETHIIRRIHEPTPIVCMLILEGADLNVGLARFKLADVAAALQA